MSLTSSTLDTGLHRILLLLAMGFSVIARCIQTKVWTRDLPPTSGSEEMAQDEQA